MAGTTVADEGSVMAAFTAAMEQFGLVTGAPGYDEAMTVVHATMGQSKIEVFRRILGGEEQAQRANQAFEASYADAVRGGPGHAAARRGADHLRAARGGHPGLPGHWLRAADQGRAAGRAGLVAAHRPGPVPGRRGPRPPVARPAADRPASG